ncbi:hypothetical protein [Clostridioides difficile]
MQLVLAVLLYWPFFKIMERQQNNKKQKEETKNIFSKEEEDLLDDLGLDF